MGVSTALDGGAVDGESKAAEDAADLATGGASEEQQGILTRSMKGRRSRKTEACKLDYEDYGRRAREQSAARCARRTLNLG